MTVRQAAERIGVSISLIYLWVESKALPHYRAGARGKRGKIVIAEADLLAFWESLKVAAVLVETRAAPPVKCATKMMKLKHISL